MNPNTVEKTKLPDGKIVSTVRLPFDHSFGGPIPMLFETMVFPSESNFGELDMDRYPTKEAAIAGHAAMVEKWSSQS